MALKKIAFIVNPIAGGKNKEDLLCCIPQVFPQSEGYHTEIFSTQKSGDAERAAADFVRQGFSRVIAVGGDGTVNETARPLCGADAAMGIVPYGSGNGLARHLGLPLAPLKALYHIKQASVCRIDACQINGIPFFCTAGVGFDALISDKFARCEQRGTTSYIKLIAQEITAYQPQPYRLSIGSRTIERTAFLITFANASQWGNNGWIAPRADLSDGLMDVAIINAFPLYKLPYLICKLLTKNIDIIKEAEIIKCASVVLERESDGCIHIDGEPSVAGSRIEVKIVPQALNVLK